MGLRVSPLLLGIVALITVGSLVMDFNSMASVAEISKKHSNSVALCIRGSNRNIQNAHNFREIFGYFDVDFFISGGVYNDSYLNITNPVATEPGADAKTIMELLKKEGFNESIWKNVDHANALQGITSPGTSLFQYYDLLRCHMMIVDQEKKRGQEYASVIVLRSDHWCFALPFLTSDNLDEPTAIQIPRGEDYGGLHDRMSKIPRQFSEQLLCGPWRCLTRNEPIEYFRRNVEYVWRNLVSETQAPVVRNPRFCFVACMYSTVSWLPCTGVNAGQIGYQGYKYSSEYGPALSNSQKFAKVALSGEEIV